MKTLPLLLCLIYIAAAFTGPFGTDNPDSIKDSNENTEKIVISEEQTDKEKEEQKSNCHGNAPKNIPLNILVHLQSIGDVTGHDNEWVGTKGESRRLQGFSIVPQQVRDDFYLEYFAHLEGTGDTPYVRQGTFVGTRGQSRRLEGFAIRVSGKNGSKYDVFYRAHLQDTGDTVEFKNDEFCGSRGESRRVEAIFVRLVKKDDD